MQQQLIELIEEIEPVEQVEAEIKSKYKSRSETDIETETETETDSNNASANGNDVGDANGCGNNVESRESEVEEQEDVTLSFEKGRKVAPYVMVREGVRYALYYNCNTVGRDSNNDLMIDNAFISRQHATIVIKGDVIEVIDHSTNGSSLNSKKFNHSTLSLKVGDKLSFFAFTYVLEEFRENKKSDDSELVLAGLASETAYVQNVSASGATPLNALNGLNPLERTLKCPLSGLKRQSLFTQKRFSEGFSLIELLIVIVVLGIIASISILNITSSRRAANSASAVQSLRVISSSQAAYQTGAGNGDYATSEDLLKGEYIDNSLASATLPTPSNVRQQPKSGYLFVFETTKSNGASNTLANYEISARPLLGSGIARAGDKSFFVDSTGVIRVSPSSLAPFADTSSLPLN